MLILLFLDSVKCLTGQWKAGSNAGGQVSHRTFSNNPQIQIDIPSKREREREWEEKEREKREWEWRRKNKKRKEKKTGREIERKERGRAINI